MGTPLAGARGGAPLSGFGCGFCSCISEIRDGVAGRNRPAEVGGGGPQGRRQGGDFLPQGHILACHGRTANISTQTLVSGAS